MALEICSFLAKEMQWLSCASLTTAAHSRSLARDTTFHRDFTGNLGFGDEEGKGHFLLRALSSSLSAWIWRAMAPGAVQHFCHRDERSLDFTFPGSDRPQNYGPELLFPVPLTSADRSVSLLLTLSSAGSQSGLPLWECHHCCPSCPRFCCLPWEHPAAPPVPEFPVRRASSHWPGLWRCQGAAPGPFSPHPALFIPTPLLVPPHQPVPCCGVSPAIGGMCVCFNSSLFLQPFGCVLGMVQDAGVGGISSGSSLAWLHLV